MATIQVFRNKCDICDWTDGQFDTVEEARQEVLGDSSWVIFQSISHDWEVCSIKCLRDYLVRNYKDPAPRSDEEQAAYDRARQDTKDRQALTTHQSKAEQWETALQVGCPICHEDASLRCINMALHKKGIHREKGWPHPERVIRGRRYLEAQEKAVV